MFKTKKRTMLVYGLLGVVSVLLSLIGLFFGIWEIVCVMSIAFAFSFLHLVACLYLGAEAPKDRENNHNGSVVFILSITRITLIALSLVIPALIIYFCGDSDNKYRSLYILIGGYPIFTSILAFFVWSLKK